ncbi:MAG TPA: HIT family protein [Terriglobales bacterium]
MATEAGCTFCDVVSGQIRSVIVFEDQDCLGFLDHRPLFPGHTLLVPKRHIETLIDLPDKLVSSLFSSAKLLTAAVQDACRAGGSFVAINNKVSQSVPHLHVHIVPRRKGDGLKGFFWPRFPYKSEEDKQAIAQAIREEVARLEVSQKK